MQVYLVPNTTKHETALVARQAAAILQGCNVDIIANKCLEDFFHLEHTNNWQLLPPEHAEKNCDIVITIGGDGTLLHAARQTIYTQKPLLGINTGRLGFLTTIEQDELHKLSRLSNGEYSVEHRSVLQAEYGKQPLSCLALNDIVLFKQTAEKTISLEISCDDIPLSRFRGDGVVFATPTGSTAYSLSAGGPILDASLQAIVVTQICAHIVQTPPMVLAGNRVVHVTFTGPEDEKMLISCDGVRSVELQAGETITIQQAPMTVPLIQFTDANQLKSIDKKLKGR